MQVAEVMAGELDPTWLGQAFEVTEEGRDGPLVHGMRLVSYRKVTGREAVVLVGENTSVVVESAVRLAFYTEPAVPGRFTGAVVDAGLWQQQGVPAAAGVPVGMPGMPGPGVAAGGGSPVTQSGPGVAGPVGGPVAAPGTPVAPAAPWMRPRPGP
ncbi:hypothetical protein [Kitasatospora aureofaciens]|uniref:hypothetical protein n=1 Tax=Kitasatospora aureofaciens TaxID=1894 RepID=UPI000B0901F7|nr:hypothetical protein [Kitasatospora aureofaciens]